MRRLSRVGPDNSVTNPGRVGQMGPNSAVTTDSSGHLTLAGPQIACQLITLRHLAWFTPPH